MTLLLVAAGAASAGAAAGPGLARIARSTLRRGTIGRSGIVCISAGAAGSAGLLVARWADQPLLLPGFLLFAAAGIAASAVDIAEYRLPDALVLPAAAATTVLLVAGALLMGAPGAALGAVVGAVALAALFLLLAVLARGRFGMGDVKLGLVAGAATGALGLHAWLLGMLAGVVINGVVAAAALLLRRRGLRGSIPFGPSIVLGTLLALLLG